MTPTIKTVLALIFAILLFSWILSLMPQRDGFDPTIPEIDQINYMHLAENTRDPQKDKKENMDDESSSQEDIKKRLAILDGTSPSVEMSDKNGTPTELPSESMLNMSLF